MGGFSRPQIAGFLGAFLLIAILGLEEGYQFAKFISEYGAVRWIAQP
jgi:hypothetical protein